MSYRDRQRLSDIQAAIYAIRSHLQRGTLADGLVFDAVRIRLLEIGEAVKALPADLLDTQPTIPWSQIARCVHLAHRYFDTAQRVRQRRAAVPIGTARLLTHAGCPGARSCTWTVPLQLTLSLLGHRAVLVNRCLN